MSWLLKLCLASPLIQPSYAAASAHHAQMMQLAKTSRSSTQHGSLRALAGFERYANELAEQYRKTGRVATSEVDMNDLKDAINTIKQYISEDYDRNLKLHLSDQEWVSGCSTKFTDCTDKYWSQINLDHAYNLTYLINTSRDLHYSCRVEQKKCCDETGGENSACAEYDLFRHGAAFADNFNKPQLVSAGDGTYSGEIASEFPSCANDESPTEDHTAGAYLEPDDIKVEYKEDEYESGSSILNMMEDCLERVHAWHQPLYHRYKNCTRARECCDPEHEPNCKDTQKEFEFRVCVGHDYINDHCKFHRDCWEKAIDECDSSVNHSVCAQIAQNVEIRKAENETGERIICLLDVLVLENDVDKRPELDACVSKTYDLSFWNITCPAGGEQYPPAYPAVLAPYCVAPPGPRYYDHWLPCDSLGSEGFLQEEYYVHESAGTWVASPGSYSASQNCIICPGHVRVNSQERNTTFTVNKDVETLDSAYAVSDSS